MPAVPWYVQELQADLTVEPALRAFAERVYRATSLTSAREGDLKSLRLRAHELYPKDHRWCKKKRTPAAATIPDTAAPLAESVEEEEMEMGWDTSNPVPCILAGALGAVTAGAPAANKVADAVVPATGTAEGVAMVADSTAIDADVADAGPLVVSSRDPSPGQLPSTANWMAQIPWPLRVGGVDQGHEALSSLMFEGAWLHGEIIIAWGVAQQRTPSHEHLGKMRWVSPWLYPAAVAAHSQQRAGLPSLEGFALVRELSAGLDLRRDRVVIPVHTTDGGAEHWSLCVVQASSRQLLMCDSLAGANRECVDNHRAQAVLWWLQAVESAELRYQELRRQPWTVHCTPSTMQKQFQGDCGVFLCFWGSWAGSGRALSKAPPINPTCLRLRMAIILLSTAARE